MYTKKMVFEAAVEITKEYARGGNGAVAPTFESIHEMLKQTAIKEGILLDR